MGLIVYECQRADHGHEIRQFGEVARKLREYYDDRQELALLVGNINIGNINLDGLIIKNDAIIILELKDRSGTIVARINGDWTCDGEIIKGGGSGKTVFEQLKVNRRELKAVLGRMFSQAQVYDIQGLVVFSELKRFTNELDRDNRQWVHVSDVFTVGNAMHDIKARAYVDYRNDRKVEAVFTRETICSFIRSMKLPESALVTDLSDTNLLPSDLFHKDAPHNGKTMSTATQLAAKSAEVEALKSQLEDLNLKIQVMELDHQKEVNDRAAVINQQKAELLVVKSQLLKEEQNAMEEMLKSETAEKRIAEIKTSLDAISGEAATLAEEKVVLERKIAEADEEKRLAVSKLEAMRTELENLKRQLAQRGEATVSEPQRSQEIEKKPIFVARRQVEHKKEWDVDEKSMDDDQLDLIEQTLDKSMLVAGCAGSGKSVIAMNKAVQIMKSGEDVVLIALTKSLNRYMGFGKVENGLGNRFFYHWQWEKAGKPTADYIIVDEIQDFTKEQIQDFIRAAKKSYFFFGDTAQSIYRAFGVNTLTIDQIAELTGLKPLYLFNNYRLPRAVAKITQQFVGVDVNPYNERIYQSKERSVPHIIQCESEESEAKMIADLIRKRDFKSIGILMPSNDAVLKFYERFTDLGIPCEYKYSKKGHRDAWRDNLDFRSELPKIMTYHSAKGLQFEAVFLPQYQGASGVDDRKALYVAMTRTWRELYVSYVGELKVPLSNVPPQLYLRTV